MWKGRLSGRAGRLTIWPLGRHAGIAATIAKGRWGTAGRGQRGT